MVTRGLKSLLIVILIAACHADARSPYPVKNSGLLFGGGNLGTYAPIYWLDNQRVLFPGYEIAQKIGPDGRKQQSVIPPGLYIWDINANTHIRHADLESPRWGLCFNNGFILYSINSIAGGDTWNKRTIMAGLLGQEKLLPTGVPWDQYPEYQECQPWPHEKHTSNFDHALIYSLRPDDGEIVVTPARKFSDAFDPTNQDNSVSLLRPDGKEPITLPILAKEMYYGSKLTYSEYVKKYVLVPQTWRSHDITKTGRWPKSEPIPIYLISPAGKVEAIELPPGSSYPMGAFPTRHGVFWISNDAPSGNSRDAGGWLFHDGKVTKLFDQLVNGASVSPDGCKIAYANDSHTRESMIVVQVIDLCAEQKGK